jgi:PleD family two-component response regulator
MISKLNKIPHSVPDSPHILLAGDNRRSAELIHRAIKESGFRVQLAENYESLDALLAESAHDVVLLEISSALTVEAAVETAVRIKRQDASQFVGYLADPILHTSGLAGDAIFPRTTNQLAKALHSFFYASVPD